MAFPKQELQGNRVVVLGGGNGTSRLLNALLPLLMDGTIISLHALVHMADDGGSTGRLREQYEVGAMGDVTKCLLALSALHGDIRGDKFLKALEYRFANGDFSGHTLRNVILTALELTSDLDAAIATFARVLQVPKYAGVIPTSLHALTQQVVLRRNGEEQLLGSGQHYISWNVNVQANPEWKAGDIRVTFAEQSETLNPRAKKALDTATHIIIAPGHTYGSILPTLASLSLGGMSALKHSKAHISAVMTLLTTPLHTVGWSGEDFVRVYESYIGRPIDLVIANSGRVPMDFVAGQSWVEFTEPDHPYQLIHQDVVRTVESKQDAHDVVPRPVLVHDDEEMKNIFYSYLTKKN
ncbi:MAG TPA: 2-phospho-L-lactate transferase CofD family protein [Candidatus Andersenbacteria bacterium]|nr:2-phospho-L-lactate transferase CofD family protein [Candidatus Andersenbacteria bacterium]